MGNGSDGARFFGYLAAAILALALVAALLRNETQTAQLRRVRAELDAAQERIDGYEAEEQRRMESEREEQARNAVPPEKEKPAGEADAAEILLAATVVAHALGAADNIPMLNCREGFEQNYAAGVRAFEVDIRLTADGRAVLRHDWRANWQDGISERHIPTLEEFLAKPILGKYTPLSFRDLLLLMEEYPDVCIVTDTKFTDAEIVTAQFGAMLDDAHALGLSCLFDRMAIQVYTPLMFSVVDHLHRFPCYIYTFYQDGFQQTEEDFRDRASFCRDNGILGVTMQEALWRDEYAPIAAEYGIAVFVHTVNDASDAADYLGRGVGAVYTDTLLPAELEGE